MRSFVLFLLILFSFTSSFAQKGTQGQDSSVPPSVKLKIDNLNNVAFDTYLNSPDSARRIAEDALVLAQQSNYIRGKGKSFYNIGLVYWSQSYYTIALFYFSSALDNTPFNDPGAQSDCYGALGRTYADLKNYQQALLNFDKASKFAQSDSLRIAEVYNQRAYVYCALKEYDKAINAAQFALKINLKANATGNIAIIYARLCSIYRGKNDNQTALDYADVAMALSKKTFNRRLRAKMYIEYANIFNNSGNYDKAIAYAQMGLRLADSIGVNDARKSAYQAIVEGYELKQDLKQALAYEKKSIIISDSVTMVVRLKTISLFKNYYKLNARLDSMKIMELKDRDNREKIKMQNKLILILSVILIALISILTVTYYYYKQKKVLSIALNDKNKVLHDQKTLIETQSDNLQKVNNLKDKLLAVIGHDLRTPVANMSNIIEMFSEGYLTPAEVSDLMRAISPVLKGAELTLSNLTEWAGSQIKGQTINTTNVDIFLLGVEMEQTFAHSMQLKQLHFNNKAYPGQGVLADENHMKVILRNLVGNAIKFTGHKGVITLSTIIEKKQVIISVKDNGKGMSEDEIKKLFFLKTHFSNSGTSGEKGTGLGLLLCKELVELNGGKLRVESKTGKGSIFYFNLPLIKAYA